MPKPITLDQLQVMTPKQIDTIYENAVRQSTPEADRVVSLILEHDLMLRTGGGLPNHHPVILAIEEVIRSPEGRSAAKTASDKGQPAMAGLDPLLVQKVGSAYGTYDTTSWAGTFAADVMADWGYVQNGKRPMPPESVAKTAAFFEPR